MPVLGPDLSRTSAYQNQAPAHPGRRQIATTDDPIGISKCRINRRSRFMIE